MGGNCAKTAELDMVATAVKGNHMIQKGKRSAVALSRASQSAPDSAGPGLDRVVQARIGDNLRAMYDELLQQPVPDRFRDLLGQLEQPREGTEHKR
jgi:hypothetical protein